MYTLNEINEAANAKAWKMFWVWILVFGLPMAFLTYITLQDRLAPSGLIQSIIFGDFVAFFGAGLMAWVASSNTKKKMLEENAQEESEQREEHYRKMEELIEKMSKNKETT